MTPMEDFEHQLLLSTFSLASHSLRMLAAAGLLDDKATMVIRNHLYLLQAKIDRLDVPEEQAEFQDYLDTLTGVLPPTTSGDSSSGAR